MKQTTSSVQYDYYEEESSDDISKQITLKPKITEKTENFKKSQKSKSQTLAKRTLILKNRKMDDVWESASDSDNDISIFDEKISTYRPKNTLPLPKRYFESTTKRNSYIIEERKKKQESESLKNTFKPEKFTKSNWKPKCEHKFRNVEESEYIRKKTEQTKMNKNSMKIVKNLNEESNQAFLVRQSTMNKKKNCREKEALTKKTTMSMKTLNRLAQPKKQKDFEEEEERRESKKKTYCTQDTISRMIRSYVEKNQRISEANEFKKSEEERPAKSFLSEYSRELTSNIGKRDQFQESIKKREERERISREKKEFDDYSEMRDCTFQPDITESRFYRESILQYSIQ